MVSARPVLFHDPTSEPSRAVLWLCLAAGIPVEVEYVWLTRGEHRSSRLLAVNPRHQVPALAHGDLALSEATAIMAYLAELAGCGERWFGDSLRARARVQMLLSWYHTNLRLKISLRYMLPLLLMPVYHGQAPPPAEELASARAGFAETLEQLDGFLQPGPFLCGAVAAAPDLLFAAELFALDMDVDRHLYLEEHPPTAAWLERMRSVDGYGQSHRPWNHVVPMIMQRWRAGERGGAGPGWVADACVQALGPGATEP